MSDYWFVYIPFRIGICTIYQWPPSPGCMFKVVPDAEIYATVVSSGCLCKTTDSEDLTGTSAVVAVCAPAPILT